MSSYTTSAFDANPEIARGYQAVIFGNYQVHGGTVSIRDYDDTPLREASVFETIGITRCLDDMYHGRVTEYSDETRRMLHLAAAVADDDWLIEALEREADWHDYADTVASVRFGFSMF